MSLNSTATADQIADQVVFLLRHLGPQREREMIDSLGISAAVLRQTIDQLAAAKRIERQAPDRWRLIPTSNASVRGTRTVSHGR